MPEAPVDEDGDPLAREDDVDAAPPGPGDDWCVDPVSEPKAVQRTAKSKLGPRIASTLALHLVPCRR